MFKTYLFYTDEAMLLTSAALLKQSNMSHYFRLILCFICRYFMVLLVCRHVSYLDLRLQEERKQSSLSPPSERSLFPEIQRPSQQHCMNGKNTVIVWTVPFMEYLNGHN